MNFKSCVASTCRGTFRTQSDISDGTFANIFNLLQPNVAFLFLLETSENLYSGGIEEQNWAVMG